MVEMILFEYKDKRFLSIFPKQCLRQSYYFLVDAVLENKPNVGAVVIHIIESGKIPNIEGGKSHSCYLHS